MIIVPVSTRGEVVLLAEVMRHLGIQAGQKIGIVLLPQNRAEIRAAHELEGSVEELFGLLKNKASGNVLTIEEINQSISECDADGGGSIWRSIGPSEQSVIRCKSQTSRFYTKAPATL